MTELTVSIALCTYNGERFLQKQLDSLAAQSRLPDELVVCDDGSTDDTVAILEQFAENAPFPVRIFLNDHNLGYAKNFEKAAQLCVNDIIFFCDQDDLWDSTKIDVFMRIFQSEPNVGLVMSDAQLIDENDRPKPMTLAESMSIRVQTLPKLVKKNCSRFSLKYFITWQGMAIAYRNRVFNPILFPYPHGMGHDTWTVRIIGAVAEARFLTQTLTKYRIHENNVSGTNTDTVTMASCIASAKNPGLADYYRQVHFAFTTVSQRLNQFPDRLRFKCTPQLFTAKAEHYRVRYKIHVKQISKLLGLLCETFNGRYFRYSRGIKSIVSDMLS